jgi:hypothetical protein
MRFMELFPARHKLTAITYATSTPVRLHSQFFLHHNRKYFVLCRYGRPGNPASPRVSGALTTACTR